MYSDDDRVAAAFYRRHSLTAQPQAAATALVLRAQLTLISPPKLPDEPWPPSNRPPHEPGVAFIVATQASGTAQAPPPRLLMRLVRGTTNDATSTRTEQYPCSLPMTAVPAGVAPHSPHAHARRRVLSIFLVRGGHDDQG